MAISDIIDPEVLAAAVNERLAYMIPQIPGLDTSTDFAIGNPGTSWDIPYNKILTDMVIDGESVTLTPQALSQSSYKMVVQRAAQAYKDEDIAKMVAASDPANNLTSRLAEKVIEYMLARRLDVLDGAIPTANRYEPASAVVDTVLTTAKQKLGDKQETLKFALMHSNTYNKLESLGDIVWQPESNILPVYTQTNQLGVSAGNVVPTCAGMRLIQTDKIGVVSQSSKNNYPIYLLGADAMGLFWQKNLTVAQQREELIGGGYTAWVPRINFVMCLHGVSYTESTTPQSYTSANLKLTTNYTLRWDAKNIAAVRVLVNAS
jgi:hypothetical protein